VTIRRDQQKAAQEYKARWDGQTWPTIKAEMKKALEMRSRIQLAGWFD
jgi:hypothetical protein